jgi:UDP:flavonoid glycosyltransferase YjiC (YdhE family)
MRVLFASWAASGHLAPLVPLGWALRAAGHEVLVAIDPSYAGQVTRAGLPALPVGPDIDLFALFRARRDGEPWRPGRAGATGVAPRAGLLGMKDVAEAVAEAQADDLVRFARAWRPDLVVYEPVALAGPLVARVLGVPAVRHLWTVDYTTPANGFPDTVAGDLARRFGLAEFGVLGDLTLDPCPPALQVADDLPREPVRYVPYNGPSVSPDGLATPTARRRVCVTWGASLGDLRMSHMRHVPGIVRALGALDAEVVVAVLDGHRDLFAGMPANVSAVGPVPLHLLLPTCDAVVHQGGAGTLMTALAAGVPQVVVPTVLDNQRFNARHLAATGAGVQVTAEPDDLGDAVLAHAGTVLDDPAYRRAAGRLRVEHARRPTPAEVVPVLKALAGAANGGRPPALPRLAPSLK